MAKVKKIEEIPERWAKVYAVLAKKNPIVRDQCLMFSREIAEFISAGAMLDAGTGSGYIPLEIAQLTKDLKITGVDLSSAIVKIASEYVDQLGVSDRIKFIQADVSRLPFADNSFDFVCSTASIHLWAKPYEGLKEIIRVVKPKGEIWIYDLKRDNPTKEIKKEMRLRYGWLRTFHFLNFVKRHNSVCLDEIRELICSPGISKNAVTIEHKGLLFKMVITKSIEA